METVALCARPEFVYLHPPLNEKPQVWSSWSCVGPESQIPILSRPAGPMSWWGWGGCATAREATAPTVCALSVSISKKWNGNGMHRFIKLPGHIGSTGNHDHQQPHRVLQPSLHPPDAILYTYRDQHNFVISSFRLFSVARDQVTHPQQSPGGPRPSPPAPAGPSRSPNPPSIDLDLLFKKARRRDALDHTPSSVPSLRTWFLQNIATCAGPSRPVASSSLQRRPAP